jgi:hypothetical protein
VQIKPSPMPVREAIIVLQLARQAFANGVVFAEEQRTTPMLPEDAAKFIPKTIKGLMPTQGGHHG